MAKGADLINKTLTEIKEQTGLELVLCTYFTGLKTKAKRKYFNVVLKEPLSESREYDVLIRFSEKYNTIKVSPNGCKRVVIFIAE